MHIAISCELRAASAPAREPPRERAKHTLHTQPAGADADCALELECNGLWRNDARDGLGRSGNISKVDRDTDGDYLFD